MKNQQTTAIIAIAIILIVLAYIFKDKLGLIKTPADEAPTATSPAKYGIRIAYIGVANKVEAVFQKPITAGAFSLGDMVSVEGTDVYTGTHQVTQVLTDESGKIKSLHLNTPVASFVDGQYGKLYKA